MYTILNGFYILFYLACGAGLGFTSIMTGFLGNINVPCTTSTLKCTEWQNRDLKKVISLYSNIRFKKNLTIHYSRIINRIINSTFCT